MSNILIGYKNRGDLATLADGSWDSTYVAGNLQVSTLASPARTTSAAAASTRLRVDLGANYALRTLALTHHNLTESSFWRARVGLAPFDVDFSNGTIDSRITASSSANGTVFNENGVIVAAATTGRLDYDSLDYLNGFLASEDLTNASWGFSVGTRALDTKTVVFGLNGNMQFFNNGAGNVMDLAVDTYTVTGKARLVSGDGQFRATGFNGTTNFNSSAFVATNKWQRFTLTFVVSAAGYGVSSVGIDRSFTGTEAVIQFKQLQVSRGVVARPYRKTTVNRLYRCRGLLREEQRTNLLLNSGSPGGTSWTVSAAAGTTLNATTSPAGTTTATKVVPDNGSNNGFVNQSVTVTSSTVYVHSFYGKAAEQSVVSMVSGLTGSAIRNSFNLTSGTVSSTGVGWVNFIQPVGKGWYRCISVGTSGSSVVSDGIQLGNNSVWTGDGTSGLYVWGAQIEQASFATSYIPTTVAQVTRTADSYVVSGTNFTSWFSQGRGTLYGEYLPRQDSSVSLLPTSAAISDGTANNQIVLRVGTSDDAWRGSITAAGVSQADEAPGPTTTYDYTTFGKVVIGYDTNWVKVAANGTLNTVDSSATIPTTMTQLEIGAVATASAMNGWIRKVTWWPWALDDSQLTVISSSGPSAFDYDTGWIPTLQFGFAQEDVPTDWGKRGYNLLTAFDVRPARYCTIELSDQDNAAGYLEIARLFVSGGIQPAINATYGGYADSRKDFSTSVVSESGREFGTSRRRQKMTMMSFQAFTQAEANELHEIHDLVGTVDEVLFVPDPADLAMSQRYGGLGLLAELAPIEAAFVDRRATSFKWKEKM